MKKITLNTDPVDVNTLVRMSRFVQLSNNIHISPQFIENLPGDVIDEINDVLLFVNERFNNIFSDYYDKVESRAETEA